MQIDILWLTFLSLPKTDEQKCEKLANLMAKKEDHKRNLTYLKSQISNLSSRARAMGPGKERKDVKKELKKAYKNAHDEEKKEEKLQCKLTKKEKSCSKEDSRKVIVLNGYWSKYKFFTIIS